MVGVIEFTLVKIDMYAICNDTFTLSAVIMSFNVRMLDGYDLWIQDLQF